MKEPKYYFAFVRVKWIYYRSDNNIPIAGDDNEFQIVLDTHPLEWQTEYNKEHEMMPMENSGTYKRMTQKMVVVSWQKLTLEEYKKFKDIINEDE